MNEVQRPRNAVPGSRDAHNRSVEPSANLVLLKDYQTYLRVEKGLRPLTCEAYLGDLGPLPSFSRRGTACC